MTPTTPPVFCDINAASLLGHDPCRTPAVEPTLRHHENDVRVVFLDGDN